jgi:hypothetical protein
MVRVIESSGNEIMQDEMCLSIIDDAFGTDSVYEITMTDLISIVQQMIGQISCDGSYAIPIYLEEKLRNNQSKRRVNPSRKRHMVR